MTTKKTITYLTIISLLLGIPVAIVTIWPKKEEPQQNQNVKINSDNTTIYQNSTTNISNTGKTHKIQTKNNSSLGTKTKFTNDSTDSTLTKILILPYEYLSTENDYTWLSAGIPESALESFSSTNDYTLIEGNLRDKILKEIDFQQGKYIDTKSAVKIGKLYGADKVILGSYQVSNSKIKITSRIVNVATGQIVPNSIMSFEDSTNDIFKMEKSYSVSLQIKLNEIH